MKIHILRKPASKEEIREMLESLETYIKVGVDIENIWGADWYPELRKVEFGALINIRPQQGNRGMEIENPTLREKVEIIIRNLLDKELS